MTADLALAADRTARVLAAMSTAADLITDHQLPVIRVDCGAGTPHTLPDGTHRWLGMPCIVVIADPAGLLAWCEVLDVDQVVVHRSTGEPAMAVFTGALVHGDHAWKVSASIPRSASGRVGDDLPGGNLPWRGRSSYVTVPRLAAALAARGLA
jgi:hypothetical protein